MLAYWVLKTVIILVIRRPRNSSAILSIGGSSTVIHPDGFDRGLESQVVLTSQPPFARMLHRAPLLTRVDWLTVGPATCGTCGDRCTRNAACGFQKAGGRAWLGPRLNTRKVVR